MNPSSKINIKNNFYASSIPMYYHKYPTPHYPHVVLPFFQLPTYGMATPEKQTEHSREGIHIQFMD